MRLLFLALLAAWGASAAVAAQPAAAPKKTPPLNPKPVVAAKTNAVRVPARTATPAVTNAAAGASEEKTAGQDEIDKQIDKAFFRIQSGGIQEAVEMFHAVLKKDPANKRARFGLGTAYIQLQNYREALAVLEPMADEFPEDYFLKNNIAWLYATAKDHSIRNGAKAVRYAQEALLIAPKDQHVWSTLSEGYYISGQYDKALRAAEEALKLGMESAAGAEGVEEYRRQVEKNRRASQAMSVLE